MCWIRDIKKKKSNNDRNLCQTLSIASECIYNRGF